MPLFEILIIFLLLIANGVLAMAEIAIVSARKPRLKQMAEEGNAGARDALTLAASPSQFLSTVQIGITLVGILAGAFGGATLAESIAFALKQFPPLAPYGEAIGVVVVVLIITYLSLVVGELAPKRLALARAENIAAAMAPLMRMLARATAPVVHFLTWSTEAVLRLLRAPAGSEQTITQEEIQIMMDEGTAVGVFEPRERELVARVLRLDDLDVNALMTPRLEIAALDIQDSDEVIRRKLNLSNHSRFPVINGNRDNVLGKVKTKDLLAQYLAGQPINLQAILQPVLYVPEGMSALELLEKFKAERTHMAMVIDEYGGIAGLVTITDLLEAIVGDIPLTDETAEAEIVEREDGSYLVDGRLPALEVKDVLDLKTLPDEEGGYYQTVGGMVMTVLGQIPAAGDHFEWLGWRFEVVDMDGRRVDKVLVTPSKNIED